ncbi:hypothetical protein ACOSP7_001432 [Xanthoceras sorbifolium]
MRKPPLADARFLTYIHKPLGLALPHLANSSPCPLHRFSIMAISSWGLVFWVLLCFFASGSLCIENFHQAFPIVEPDPGHTKLRLAREGLETISRITTPIASVAVIGPYRSGKSFLLNQLLSLSCDEGFGVGHMRDTKTKGIWVWGAPVVLDIDGVKTSVFYLDTEGFESIGKSNVYDDRIFALATVMSSVLIYNLPETIREADISRLSFAVELAEEFYGRSSTPAMFELNLLFM